MKNNCTPMFDLWEIVHYDMEHVEAVKVGETSSEKQTDQWIQKDWNNAASMHRSDVAIGESLPPHYVNMFTR